MAKIPRGCTTKRKRMPDVLISLNEASWRLETSGISGRAFAELLVKSLPLLLGVFPGSELRERLDLSRVTSFQAQPENLVVAGNVTCTGVKLNWRELRAAFEARGHRVSWTWHSNITPEMLEQSRQPTRRLLDDPRPPVRSMGAFSAIPQPERRASQEWFAGAAYTGLVPASGQAPLGRRGPRSAKRENTAAAMRQALADKTLTINSLRTMPEKTLAHRYGVSRDTARKARHNVLESFVDISASTNDK